MSYLQSVKEQATQGVSEIIGAYKEDLEEFGSVLAEDSLDVLGNVGFEPSSVLSNRLTEGVVASINNIKDGILAVEAFAEDQLSALLEESSDDRLEYLQSDIEAQDPTEDPEFLQWLSSFDWSTKQEEINQLLENEQILHIHTDLVPQNLTEREFWERYYFVTGQREEKKLTGIIFPQNDCRVVLFGGRL
eukprot:TRINITY_DN7216_c0_g1_i1.p1 TRINITY_DN7216_c0_g1~~TRINITY_DN7216_c0_g1_i1.p1  ORF type:complete len:190 (-),score=41.47 TRINITY_DN7216_c0_g1_i1:389-958(-)